MYSYAKRYKYPHMKPNDVAIWERFIAKNPDAYDLVDYDVIVGDRPRFDTVVSKETGGDALDLYRRKIDVLGYKGDTIDLIEVKPEASPAALGQLLGYVSLYKLYRDPNATIRPVLLTDVLKTDMALLAYEMGITILLA